MNYIAYCDEAYTTAERYRSIAIFSFKEDSLDEINNTFIEILKGSNVQEFKWQKLRSAKYYFCAEKIIDYILTNIQKHNIRVDVLMWDTYDSRHNIYSRDDTANFGRMFFHLLKASLNRREASSIWKIYPDERVDVDWQTINDCAKSVGRWEKVFELPLFNFSKSVVSFTIKEFEPKTSHHNPCIQIPDLFAGLSIYSINYFDKYCKWEKSISGQQELFCTKSEVILSNSERQRFRTLKYFIERPERKRLGISFNSNRRLHTYNPKNAINFWFYLPQHENDKAPKRSNK